MEKYVIFIAPPIKSCGEYDVAVKNGENLEAGRVLIGPPETMAEGKRLLYVFPYSVRMNGQNTVLLPCSHKPFS